MPLKKVYFDGIKYNFDGKNLFDFEGTLVAHVELASESNYDEYNYFIHEDGGEVMHSQHENVYIPDLALELAGAYANFNY